MTIDTASIISHLDDNAQKELKEYFDANGSVPEDVLNKYRKKKQNTIGIPEEEMKSEVPDRDDFSEMSNEHHSQEKWNPKETPTEHQETYEAQRTFSGGISECPKSEKYPNENTEQQESHAQGIQVPRILIQLIMHRVSITQKKILKNLDSGMKKMKNLKNTIQRKNTIMIQLEYMISHKKGITIPDIQIRQHL